MGHRRKLTNHQKQLRFFAVMLGVFIVLFVIAALVFMNRQPSH
jgi:ATP/ADP translocase